MLLAVALLWLCGTCGGVGAWEPGIPVDWGYGTGAGLYEASVGVRAPCGGLLSACLGVRARVQLVEEWEPGTAPDPGYW